MKRSDELEKIPDMLKSKTMKQIASDINIPYNSIYYFCKKRGLKSSMASKPGKNSKIQKNTEEIIEMYLEGSTQKEIADKFRVSTPTICHIIKRNTENMRSLSEASTLRESSKTNKQRKNQTLAASAVRHAMAILEKFSW